MPTLRIEFIKAAAAKDGVPEASAASRCLAEKELPIGATATASVDQPQAPAGATHAVLFAVGGACYVDFDGQSSLTSNAAPDSGTRFFVPANQGRVLTGFKTGAKFSCIQSSIA